MGFSCRSEQIYLHLLISIGKSCFLLQYPAWNISGHHGMNQYTEYDYFSPKTSRLVSWGWKYVFFSFCREQIYLRPSLRHIFSPIWIIFWAKIVTFSVLIRPMMTRNVLGWLLEVKTLIYQEILIGANKSVLSDMEKLIFSAPIDQSGWFFWLK